MDKRILVVDDDRLVREMIRDALAEEGFRVAAVESGARALDALRDDGPFELMLTDLSMREMDGLELMEAARRDFPRTDVIVLTAYASLESALQAMRLGAADYLRKPVRPPEIVYAVKRTVLRRRLVAENEALRGSVQALEASRVLTTCLEPGDVLPLALDIILRLTGRSRAVGRLLELTSRYADGVSLVGVPADTEDALRDLIDRRKIFDPNQLDSGAHALSGALEQELARLGLDDDEVLELPLRLDGQLVGGLWIFAERRPFTDDEVRRAELVAAQAELALVNAERFLQAREKAFIDDVTELYNARYLLAALDREASRAERSRLDLSVLFLDLDRFKVVNDTHGHLVGSRVLRELGAVLRKSIRTIDTVGRYGGDEFTILLVDTNHDGAMRVAERIRETVAETAFSGGRGLKLQLTLSIGVASFPTHGSAREDLLDRADKAMYLGKAMGRNHVCSANELTP
ncbi:MAG: diguanylate cyclase [Deltaproteobacteria bacterium]|nr:diguanylate cyclase [Deltaproteobacteria bacterium]MBW2414409.1 diguanylate cyclase [Deltaproteobacteria bacterium]